MLKNGKHIMISKMNILEIRFQSWFFNERKIDLTKFTLQDRSFKLEFHGPLKHLNISEHQFNVMYIF